MTVRKGTYVLLLTFGSDREAEAGSLGTVRLPAGLYCYVGSAMGGLDQRVSRHLRRGKAVRWHIDGLTEICDSVEAWESWPDPVPESRLAEEARAAGMAPAVDGFGCSDRPEDGTHLFRADRTSAGRLLEACGMRRFRDVRRRLSGRGERRGTQRIARPFSGPQTIIIEKGLSRVIVALHSSGGRTSWNPTNFRAT